MQVLWNACNRDDGNVARSMSLRFFTFARLLFTTAIVMGHGTGCSCRPRLTAEELDSIQEDVAHEIELQQTASDKKDRIWKELEKSFDRDRDGWLSTGEHAAFDNYLSRVKQGQVPNPFLGAETPSGP